MTVLYTAKGNDGIPADAIRVTREQALQHQRSIVRDWKNHSDVIFLRYGAHFATAVVLASSVFSINHFRTLFKLKRQGFYLSYLPGTLVPSSIMALNFNQKVTDNTLIMKMGCPLCQQLQYSLQQFFVSVPFPAVLGFLSSGFIAQKCNTYSFPNLKNNNLGFYKFMFQCFKAGALRFQTITAVNLIVTFFLPYMQQRELTKIMEKLENSSLSEVLENEFAVN